MVSNSYYFTRDAKNDLDEILNYIAIVLCNPNAANSFLKEIQNAITNILIFPKSHSIIENEFLKHNDIRKINVKKYILYYVYNEVEHSIIILRILYGQRDIDQLIKGI